jgi:hypothetical protein
LLDDRDNDYDDEEDDINLDIDILMLVREWCERVKNVKIPRVEKFIDNTVDRYNEIEFKSHFRVTRRTFGNLENLLSGHITSQNGDEQHQIIGHPFTEPRKQILFALWLLGSPESYRYVHIIQTKNKMYVF